MGCFGNGWRQPIASAMQLLDCDVAIRRGVLFPEYSGVGSISGSQATIAMSGEIGILKSFFLVTNLICCICKVSEQMYCFGNMYGLSGIVQSYSCRSKEVSGARLRLVSERCSLVGGQATQKITFRLLSPVLARPPNNNPASLGGFGPWDGADSAASMIATERGRAAC